MASEKTYPFIRVYITKNRTFRAFIRPSATEPPYSVTVGGEQWRQGKGREHSDIIRDKVAKLVKAMNSEYRTLKASGLQSQANGKTYSDGK